MTQEYKQLLLKDLCGRLPYRVFMGNKEWNRKPYQLTCDEVQYMIMSDDYEDVPYLRPMSSMTEEEREEFRLLGGVISYNPNHNTYSISAFSPEAYDWLNKKMFDYRGLIPKGLANSTEKFNPYNIEKL